MVPIRDDVRIAIKAQERGERLGLFDDIPAQHHPALRREISRDEKPQAVEFAGNDQLAPQVGEDSSISLVHRLGVGLALREIEFLLGSVHIDMVFGELAEIISPRVTERSFLASTGISCAQRTGLPLVSISFTGTATTP